MLRDFITRKNSLPLPRSNGYYRVTVDGDVIDRNGVVLITETNASGEIVVTLDWVDGVKPYRLLDLIAHAYKPLHMPVNLWGKVRAILVGKLLPDKPVHHPGNLIWMFDEPLESPTLADHYYVPGFTRYVCSKDGVVVREADRKLAPVHPRKGYRFLSVKSDTGKWTSTGEHRMYWMAFNRYPENVDELQINHMDGDKSNNAMSNLELITGIANVQHAWRLGLISSDKSYSGRKGYLIRDITSMEVRNFPSRKSACRFLGISDILLEARVSQPGQPIFDDQYQIQEAANAVDWIDPENCDHSEDYTRQVLVRDISTGEVVEYRSIVEVGNALGLHKDAIGWRLRSAKRSVFPEGKQYKYKLDKTPWEVEVEINPLTTAKSTRHRPLLVRDIRTGEVTQYNLQREAATALQVSEASLSEWVRLPNQPVVGHYYQIQKWCAAPKWRPATVDDPGEVFTIPTVAIEVRRFATGDVTLYQSSKAAAEALGLSVTNIQHRLNSGGTKVYSDGYQYKRASDPTPWHPNPRPIKERNSKSPISVT